MEGPCPCPHSPGKIESCPLYHCKHIILKYIHTYILFENTFTVITSPQFFLFSTSWLNLVHHCHYYISKLLGSCVFQHTTLKLFTFLSSNLVR